MQRLCDAVESIAEALTQPGRFAVYMVVTTVGWVMLFSWWPEKWAEVMFIYLMAWWLLSLMVGTRTRERHEA